MPSLIHEGEVTARAEKAKGSRLWFCLSGDAGVKFFIAFRDAEGFALIRRGAKLKVWLREGSFNSQTNTWIVDRAILAEAGKEVPVDGSVTAEEFAQDGLF